MKSFDIDEYNSRECQVHNHGFCLGEQSKQSEVDEFRKRIDTALYALYERDKTKEHRIDQAYKILKGDQ